jgi:hypothetical protein
MGRTTVRLPDTLHRQLQRLADSEGVSLNQYIVYALTQHVTTAVSVHADPGEEAAGQQAEFDALLDRLRTVRPDEAHSTLAEYASTLPPGPDEGDPGPVS